MPTRKTLRNKRRTTDGMNLEGQRMSTNFEDRGRGSGRTINIETRPRSTRRPAGSVIGRDVGQRGS